MSLSELFQLLGILTYYRNSEKDERMEELIRFHMQLIKNQIDALVQIKKER